MNICEKAGYPRPDFIRKDYTDLNGIWDFDFDDDGTLESTFLRNGCTVLTQKIKVPFPYQSPESGIGIADVHEKVVYNRSFEISADRLQGSVLLHFGAVDHSTDVYVNGILVGTHTGGYTHFVFDITRFVKSGTNSLTIFIKDEDSPSQCRGKQIWQAEPSGCHYVAFTGIWQDVWLEFTSRTYITEIRFICDFDNLSETAQITFNKKVTGHITAHYENGAIAGEIKQTVNSTVCRITFCFDDYSLRDKSLLNWSPNNPNLFDVVFTLETDRTDEVESYFGFRKFEANNGKFYLNNSQYYLKMVLDQGYWADGICRPSDNEAYRTDIEKTKELGFNGARKHQKFEDPRYYYWADRLGLLVWGELPSFYSFDELSMQDASATMTEAVISLRNHPSIIAWVIFNETWGLRKLLGDSRQADFARSLYYLCKSLDPSRLVSTNDGWENLNPTDIISIHDYRNLSSELIEYYSDISFLRNGSGRTGHPYMLPGENYSGQPLMLTEFGGKRSSASSGWGYADAELEGKSFRDAVNDDLKKAESLKLFSGYCYTQLTDVYQETNGILNMKRQEQ